MAKKVSSQHVAPVGFDTVSRAEFPPNWPWADSTELTGGVVLVKDAEIQRGKDKEQCKIMIVASGGLEWTVWESAGLIDLMNKVEPGDAVAIYYTGDIPLKGRPQPMKGFDCYIKKGGGHAYIDEVNKAKEESTGETSTK